jgi:hypothetical protein
MKTRRDLTSPSASLSGLWPLCAFAFALACSSGGGDDAGPPLSGQEYFNLTPGLCFEYSADDAGTPTRGLLITAVASPAGVKVDSKHHGGTEQIDYLSFDAGTVLLSSRQVFTTGIESWVFVTPLTYLQAPLAEGQGNLTSSSAFTFSSTASDAGTLTGEETLTVAVTGTTLWTGVAADAGGSSAYKMNFAGSDLDAGVSLTQVRSMLPNVGFVQLLATDDTGSFVTFQLVDIKVLDGGTNCGQ